MGFGKIFVGSSASSYHNNNGNRKDGNADAAGVSAKGRTSTPNQVTIGFGSNYYWAVAPPGHGTSIPININDNTNNNNDTTARTLPTCYEWSSSTHVPFWKTATASSTTNTATSGPIKSTSILRRRRGSSSHTGSSKSRKDDSHRTNWNDNDDNMIEQIACSAQSTIFLTKAGNIYQQGTMHGLVWSSPIQLSLPPLPLKITQIAAGRHFALALLENGLGVVSWGAGHFGQLGIGNTLNELSSDSESDNENRHHSHNNKKKTRGNTSTCSGKTRAGYCPYTERTNSRGQLLVSTKPLIIERLIPHNNVEGSPVIAIAAGDFHALALTASGRVWAWGCNRSFQCGRHPSKCCDSNNTAFDSMLQAEYYNNRAAASAAAAAAAASGSQEHATVADMLREDDLDMPTVPTVMSPIPVPLPVPIKQISAGRSHSVAIASNTDTKQVFCWGSNQHGQCGTSPSYNDDDGKYTGLKPTAVKTLDGMDIVQIAAGGNHTVALTGTGHVLTWGDHSDGQLGIINGSTVGSITQYKPRRVTEIDLCMMRQEQPQPENTKTFDLNNVVEKQQDCSPPPSPVSSTTSSVTIPLDTISSRNSSIDKCAINSIKSVYAGSSYSAAICSSGYVYVWGSNDCGQLGIPTPTNPKDIPYVKEGGRIPHRKEAIPSPPVLFPDNGTTNAETRDSKSVTVPQSVLSPRRNSSSNRCGRRSTSTPTTTVTTKKVLVRNIRTFDSNHTILLPVRLEAVGHINVQQVACGPNHMWVVGEARVTTSSHIDGMAANAAPPVGTPTAEPMKHVTIQNRYDPAIKSPEKNKGQQDHRTKLRRSMSERDIDKIIGSNGLVHHSTTVTSPNYDASICSTRTALSPSPHRDNINNGNNYYCDEQYLSPTSTSKRSSISFMKRVSKKFGRRKSSKNN